MVNLTIGKQTQKQILSLFNGNKKTPGIRGARTIADILGVPRRQVMAVLEDNTNVSYSSGSYT